MIMMSLHEVKSPCKCKYYDTSWLRNSNNQILNRQRIFFLAHLQADIDTVSFMTSYIIMSLTSWRHAMTWRHNSNSKTMIYLNSVTRKNIKTKKNHSSSTSTSWDKYSLFNDVMTSFHNVISSCEYDNNNIAEFGNNVPSKLCACARAHDSWSERTQKFRLRTQKEKFPFA